MIQLQQDVTAYVNLVIAHLPATEKRLIQIQKAQEDPSQIVLSGWVGRQSKNS